MFRTGHIPDHPAVVAKRAGMHLFRGYGAMKAITLPLATQNRVRLPTSKGGPGVRNQRRIGMCEGEAHSSGATLRLALAGTPLSEVLSAVGPYMGALMFDRVANADGTLPPLRDNGTMPSSILNAWQAFGASGESVWGQLPADIPTMYVDPNLPESDPNFGILIQPTIEQLYGESSCKLNGAYFVQSTGRQRVVDIMSALAAGFPVSDAIPASGNDFQGYRGGVLNPTSGEVDHANLILDYEWVGTQDQLTAWLAGGDDSLATNYLLIHCVNSWDVTWGEADAMSGEPGGLYRANRLFLDQSVNDACILDVVKA